MAKAKRTTKTKKDETAPAPVASAGKKEDAKTPAAPKAAAAPMIDTGMAAATAARRVLHHKDESAPPAAAARGESASFKQMKENLHKPAGQASPSFLQNVVPTKKFNPSVPGRQQVGRNQTFGADVNRSGVPRRTGG